MSNTKVDTAFDKFLQIQEMYQMKSEDIEEFESRVVKHLTSLEIGALETEADRNLEMISDSEENFSEEQDQEDE